MVRLFLCSLRNRWFEYLAASIVIAVAVTALVVQTALASSAEGHVHDLAHELGKNMLVVPEDTDLRSFYAFEFDDTFLPDSYADRIRNSDLGQHVGAMSPRLYGNAHYLGEPLVVVGQAGLFPSAAPQSPGDPIPAVVGDAMARRFGLVPGGSFFLLSRELTVADVAATAPDGLDMAVFLDLPTAQGLLHQPGRINALLMAGCWCRTDVPALARQVEQHLPGSRAITVAGVIEAQTGVITTVKRYSKVLNAVSILLIAGISALLVSAQLRRQRREVGLLLALGAHSTAVAGAFAAMAALVGITGGALGFLLGRPVLTYTADRFMDTPLQASTDSLVMAMALSLVVCTVSAAIPALRAARLDPTTILRGS